MVQRQTIKCPWRLKGPPWASVGKKKSPGVGGGASWALAGFAFAPAEVVSYFLGSAIRHNLSAAVSSRLRCSKASTHSSGIA